MAISSSNNLKELRNVCVPFQDEVLSTLKPPRLVEDHNKTVKTERRKFGYI